MKKIATTIGFSILFVVAFSQSSKITDIEILSRFGKTKMEVIYNIEGNALLNGVALKIETPFDTIIPKTLEGDFGDSITPGKNKKIEWFMTQDNIFLNNSAFKLCIETKDGQQQCVSSNKKSKLFSNKMYLAVLFGGAKFGSLGNWGWNASLHYAPDTYDYSIPIALGVSKKIFDFDASKKLHIYTGTGFEIEMTTICFDWGFILQHNSLVFNLGMGVSDFDEFYPTVGIGWILKNKKNK